ncbi:UDP-glucuronosyltransferase 2C1 [Linepithema humile]|uniref:UDP-glucuronosyltransferase 2C1 n=1 Tax=Linepithema humile TaxID=83485 RepID=UPI000623A51A|nr:PREDICTED: UDP-glucuronosyltransferase 2C1-like [Linepithema humile]XP_012216376.1 PREDICTED: UDP-glucuronosyltransferase 2C1-like [Linepithema humile]
MLVLICLYVCSCLFQFTSSSMLAAPPLTALIIAFENVYDLSLLANTLSDQGIDASLIVPSYAANDIYNNLIDVEVLQLNVNTDKSVDKLNIRAMEACDSLFRDEEILKKIRELQPTFTIFPILRHDGCLLPFAKYIESIPVIWIGNPDEELYAFECTGVALPVHNGGFWSRFSTSFSGKSTYSIAKNNYVTPTLRLAAKYLLNVNVDLEHLYSDIRLVLWGADTVLRSNFASLTQLLVEIGCHHCRGAHPLSGDLHKPLIEHRLGTIVALLDENYETLIRELAKKLPQGREGQAVVWRINKSNVNAAPENLFIRSNVDRQDLIGYSRTRVVLSHCVDTEFLEAAFHGTPMICLPRNTHESRNTARAIELGFARSTDTTGNDISADEIANIVHEIHESIAYRESARKVSLAMRDRLTPASDRLIYWLGYVARTKDDNEKFHMAMSQARTLTEDIQFFIGLLVGVILGIVCTSCAVVTRYIMTANKRQRSKGRYTR